MGNASNLLLISHVHINYVRNYNLSTHVLKAAIELCFSRLCLGYLENE